MSDTACVDCHGLVLFGAVLFHHSNVRLPYALEPRLVRLVVTPRMHGIHHSTVEREANRNYSSLLSTWDYLRRASCSLPHPRRRSRWQRQRRPSDRPTSHHSGCTVPGGS